MKPPTKNPCGSCPYRRDVPSGVWDSSEYEKLADWDKETHDQPLGLFLCHQNNGHLCSGWVGCHDMENVLGLKIAATAGWVTEEEWNAIVDYVSPVPLFSSGKEAAEHGIKNVSNPDRRAQKKIDRLTKKVGERYYCNDDECSFPHPHSAAHN